jgi:hypothetical protein
MTWRATSPRSSREAEKDQQDLKDAGWSRRVNGSIFDLRGQSLSTETSPWLARFMLDDLRYGRSDDARHVIRFYLFIKAKEI